jgi:hypothetical protein
MAKKVDFTNLKRQVGSCCLQSEGCLRCDDGNCCINNAKRTIALFEQKRLRVIANGMETIPSFDTKVYHNIQVVDAVAESLLLCKQCKENHEKDCVINVIRASLERVLFGDNIEDYKGTILQHIMELRMANEEMADSIMNAYNKIKAV